MNSRRFDAAILDMDGVITQTATLHAKAWKQMFDEYLTSRGRRENRTYAPFDAGADYRKYVDGMPRYDGVRTFLQSRGIDLPEGDPSDPPTEETVCGLGNRKNALFHELVRRDGAAVYEDAIAQIDRWKKEGMKVAVISSSRNCTEILQTAGVLDLFDAKVDGNDLKRLQLRGKPAPDMFLQAAADLGVAPERAMVVEDALAGVEAGRSGGFGLIVGVAREGSGDELRRHGADVAVSDLRELDRLGAKAPPQGGGGDPPLSALEHFDDSIATQLAQRDLALFLDYDGTLTPIVDRPEMATLSDDMRSLLANLAQRSTLAIVSGRDLADVRQMVDLDELVYAGSHGFDIAGPGGLKRQHEEATRSLPDLDAAEEALRERLRDARGAFVERKRFALAVHYRLAAEGDVPQIEQAVDAARREHPQLRKKRGKKIFELQPDVEWDKGRAVLWLREALGVDRPHVTTVYIGDDVTDEDAFRAVLDSGVGFGIIVATRAPETSAQYFLRDCGEVQQFLAALLDRLRKD